MKRHDRNINFVLYFWGKEVKTMKVAIMTDTTSYIPKDIRQKFNIYTVPLSVIFGEDSYREDMDITTEEFYEKVRNAENLPTTSQPAIGEVVDTLEKLSEEYDAVVTIHLSSKISGTFQAVKSAGEMVESIDVYPFDSSISAMAQGFYVLEAAERAEAGDSPEEIIAHLERMKKYVRAYFMVDDLNHLQHGGRLSNAQAIIGSLLKIKPILHFEDGFIVPFEKIRTKKKAVHRIIGMLEEQAAQGNVKRVVFIHANDEPAAIELEKSFIAKYPDVETMISYFGPVIGTHLGEKSLGVSWYTE